MKECNENDKYLKVIECLGEVLLNKDMAIQINEYEIKALKRKVEQLEQQMNKEASEMTLKQSV